MPYDPRSVTDGGNRGIDVLFTREAPKGRFRVIGVDTFDGTDWLEGDFDTQLEASQRAKSVGGNMQKAYVYDDKGESLYSAGTF